MQEAIAEQGANDLLAHVSEHLVRHKQILRNQSIAKAAAKVAGYGVAGAAGGSTRFASDSVNGPAYWIAFIIRAFAS
jgi:hypothetical protein